MYNYNYKVSNGILNVQSSLVVYFKHNFSFIVQKANIADFYHETLRQ